MSLWCIIADTLEAFHQDDKCRDVIDFTQVLAAGAYNSFSALAAASSSCTSSTSRSSSSASGASGFVLGSQVEGISGGFSTSAATAVTTCPSSSSSSSASCFALGVGPGCSSAAGTTAATSTTTTTVVVTHGNGETETIIEGEDLPPGTNEMIMSAAAATFPLECFPLQGALQVLMIKSCCRS